jgi:transcriptional regulator with XRE-family HTH domain
MDKESVIRNNIVKIRKSKGIKQATMAANIGMEASTYSRIERGKLGLTVDKLSKIASCFGMSMIDVIAYPKHFVNVESLSKSERNEYTPKVVVQIELEKDRKEQVLKLLLSEQALSTLGMNQKEYV